MPILTPCTHCERKVRVDILFAGSQLACPACDHLIDVPRPVVQPRSDQLDSISTTQSDVGLQRPIPSPKLTDNHLRSPENLFQHPVSKTTSHRFIEPEIEPHQGHLLFALALVALPLSLLGGIGVLMSIHFWRVAYRDTIKITAGKMDAAGESLVFNSMMFNSANIVIFGFIWAAIYLLVVAPMLISEVLG